ncbi:MAG: phosphoribosylglycinamide formyltransferase [Candidatus Omnitrophica bacterium]|nr:phosphoribosylglycinamide formyltransferase [Candidatus Omnitrophota bacterium]
MKTFAVLASGNGSNLQAIMDAIKKKKIKANLKLVLSDKADAFALERAKKAKIATIYINPKDFSDREAYDRKVIEYLKESKVDFIVLAGYMRLLSAHFIKQYPNRIMNIHPALLPSFKGIHGIRDAFEYGVKVTGVTVHFVSEEMDAGAIIIQETVKVTQKDTLKTLTKKIHKVEHKVYPQAIDWFSRQRLKISGRKVLLR